MRARACLATPKSQSCTTGGSDSSSSVFASLTSRYAMPCAHRQKWLKISTDCCGTYDYADSPRPRAAEVHPMHIAYLPAQVCGVRE